MACGPITIGSVPPYAVHAQPSSFSTESGLLEDSRNSLNGGVKSGLPSEDPAITPEDGPESDRPNGSDESDAIVSMLRRQCRQWVEAV